MGVYTHEFSNQKLGLETQYFIPNSEIEPKTKAQFGAVPDFKSIGLIYTLGNKDFSFISIKGSYYEFDNLSPETAKQSEIYGNSIKQYSLDLKEFAYNFKGSELKLESNYYWSKNFSTQINAEYIENLETIKNYGKATSIEVGTSYTVQGKVFTPTITKYEISRDSVPASISSAKSEFWGSNRRGYRVGMKVDWLKNNCSLTLEHNENNPIFLDDAQDKFTSTGIQMELRYE